MEYKITNPEEIVNFIIGGSSMCFSRQPVTCERSIDPTDQVLMILGRLMENGRADPVG